jgi:hypothetical protein
MDVEGIINLKMQGCLVVLSRDHRPTKQYLLVVVAVDLCMAVLIDRVLITN